MLVVEVSRNYVSDCCFFFGFVDVFCNNVIMIYVFVFGEWLGIVECVWGVCFGEFDKIVGFFYEFVCGGWFGNNIFFFFFGCGNVIIGFFCFLLCCYYDVLIIVFGFFDSCYFVDGVLICIILKDIIRMLVR